MSMPRRAWIGLFIASMYVFGAIAAPWIAPYDPLKSTVDALAPPSWQHWMGTDALGRDVLSRVLYGARTSLLIGVGGALLATMIGVPIGLCAAYNRGNFDRFAVWFIDLFISMPVLVLALIITSIITPSVISLFLVMGLVMWPSMGRLVRGQALVICETLFVEAARGMGGSSIGIIVRHIWPNVTRVVAAQFSVAISVAIFTSASLSFLGLGIPPPTPDWGDLVRSGFDYLTVNPAISLGPGLAVTLAVTGFYLFGTSMK